MLLYQLDEQLMELLPKLMIEGPQNINDVLIIVILLL